MIALTAFAGVLGAVFGSFADATAYRVPRGISLQRESSCDTCAKPVRWYRNVPVLSWIALRGQCRNCGASIGIHAPLIEAGTAVAFVIATIVMLWLPSAGRPSWWLELITVLFLIVVSAILIRIDLEFHRLPNAVVLPSVGVIVVLLGAAAIVDGDIQQLGRMLAGGAIQFALYGLIRLISPRGIGGGDVKLAAASGLALGYIGWGALGVGAFAAFLTGGLFGLVLILLRRATRRTAVAFGPWMIIGAWIGASVGEPVWALYFGLMS